MIFQWFIEGCATALGITTEQAGIFMSIVFILGISFAFTVAIAGTTKSGKLALLAMLGAICVGFILFTFMGWFPTWTGAVLALIFAGLFAKAAGGL